MELLSAGQRLFLDLYWYSCFFQTIYMPLLSISCILFAGFPCIHLYVCDHTIKVREHGILQPFVEISSDLHLRCIWRQR